MKVMTSSEVVGFYQVLDNMHKKGLVYFFLTLLIIALWQCSETKEIAPDSLGTKYFPLKTGMYQIYQVNGVRYNSYTDSIVFSYLLKESVVDSFQNLESGISYKIQQEKKYNENDSWVIDSIWTARKYDQYAVSIENNIPIVSLTFPVKENKTWDGNKLNDLGEDEFEMIDVDQPYSSNSFEYEKTVTVIQEELPDIYVQSILKKEIFAEGQGLIYKENSTLNYRQGDDYSNEVIETGIKYIKQLIEYGEK